MSTVFLTLLVVASIMLSLYSRFKKVLAEQEGMQEEAAYAAPAEAENEEQEYFTYETLESLDSNDFPTAEPVCRPAVAAETVAPLVEEPVASGFDLRRAVIYQTILNNRNINESNQFIQ